MESLTVVKTENVASEMDHDDEPMDIETPFDAYFEEGEINSSDDDDDEKPHSLETNTSSIFRRNHNTDQGGGFGSGFDLFAKNEELKKLDRAKRFSIPVNVGGSIQEVDKEQLSSLYKDLGIDKENERHYRFNAIHMRGTDNMSTEDVFQYFISFTPSHIEWINDVSCNVVWMDDVSTAKALLNLSKRIKNLDKVHLNGDPFEKEFKEADLAEEEVNDDNSVDARQIKAAIPPGFWRIGLPAEKSSFILLRYATRCDKKQPNAERNSEYYRKYGNPHYGNIPGIFSRSLRSGRKKPKFKSKDSASLWESDHEENEVKINDKKNPWEELAYEWGKTDQTEEIDLKRIRNRNLQRNRSPALKLDVPDLRISLRNKKESRKRVQIEQSSRTSQNSSDQETWESRIKVPRMKMYADDEEKRLEKSSERSQSSNRPTRKLIEDLRSKINRKKHRSRFKFRVEKKNSVQISTSESSNSENEYDDGDSGDWALEHYHDLRESLEQNKRQKQQSFSATKYESESENDESDDLDDDEGGGRFQGNLGRRSPLQIEIDNDEYYQQK